MWPLAAISEAILKNIKNAYKHLFNAKKIKTFIYTKYQT